MYIDIEFLIIVLLLQIFPIIAIVFLCVLSHHMRNISKASRTTSEMLKILEARLRNIESLTSPQKRNTVTEQSTSAQTSQSEVSTEVTASVQVSPHVPDNHLSMMGESRHPDGAEESCFSAEISPDSGLTSGSELISTTECSDAMEVSPVCEQSVSPSPLESNIQPQVQERFGKTPPPLTDAYTGFPISQTGHFQSKKEGLFITENSSPTTGERVSNWDSQGSYLWSKGMNWFWYGKESLAPGESREYAAAANWLVRVGIIILVLGVGFFLKYSIEHGWVSPEMRVMIASITGIFLYGFGLKLWTGTQRLLGQGLVAGGSIILYFSIYSGTVLHHLIPLQVGYGCLLGITSLLVFSSLRRGTSLIAILGIGGAYLTPMLFNVIPSIMPMVIYLAILSMGILMIRIKHSWVIPLWLAVIGTYALFNLTIIHYGQSIIQAESPTELSSFSSFWMQDGSNLSGMYHFHHARLMLYKEGTEVFFSPLTQIILVLSSCLFLILHMAVNLHSWLYKREMNNAESSLLVFNALAFCGTIFAVTLRFIPREETGWITGALSIFFLVHVLLLRGRENTYVCRVFSTGLGALFLGLLIPTVFSGVWLFPLWSMEMVIFLWVSHQLESRRMELGTLILLYITLILTIVFALPSGYILPHLKEGTHVYNQSHSCIEYMPERLCRYGIPMLAGLLACLQWRMRGTSRESIVPLSGMILKILKTSFLLGFLAVSGEVWLCFTVYAPDARLGALSVLWTLIALGSVSVGILKNNRVLRKQGIMLFTVVVIKVFIFDLGGSDTLTRIISFLILGVLILVGAAIYLQAKRRVDHAVPTLEEESTDE